MIELHTSEYLGCDEGMHCRWVGGIGGRPDSASQSAVLLHAGGQDLHRAPAGARAAH